MVFNHEVSLAIFMHPEYYYISDTFLKTFILPFSSEIDTLISIMVNKDNLINPFVLIPNLIFNFLVISLFLTIFFSYYNNSSKEENTIDHDFLISNTTVEAEEEIGSIDDLMISVVIICFIFLWYF